MSSNPKELNGLKARAKARIDPALARELYRRGSDPRSPNFSWKLTWEEYVDLAQHYNKNRSQFPLDILAQHVGKWVAWETDGSAIRAVADDESALTELILSEGDDPQIYCFAYIPER